MFFKLLPAAILATFALAQGVVAQTDFRKLPFRHDLLSSVRDRLLHASHNPHPCRRGPLPASVLHVDLCYGEQVNLRDDGLCNRNIRLGNYSIQNQAVFSRLLGLLRSEFWFPLPTL
ncbi:hypothetical protein B0H13DRAFT_2293457 [Mycena leptocephala]|nr:hypothetical protein B0H13DRAFT_2293457 [Mycena leptocephala]